MQDTSGNAADEVVPVTAQTQALQEHIEAPVKPRRVLHVGIGDASTALPDAGSPSEPMDYYAAHQKESALEGQT